MSMLELGPEDALYYEWTPPSKAGAPSFVFINPITGDTSLWNAAVVPAIKSAGFGVLAYDFRGQTGSRFKPGRALDADLIVDDLKTIVRQIAPPKPILVGLSIGGLYAARAVLDGLDTVSLVLINTLRRITPRIQWMNDASLRVMQVGGPNLMKDLYFHLLVGEPFQEANRAAFLADDPDYTPLDPNSGAANLVTHMGATSWDVDWSKLELPVLSVTGLQDRVFYDADIVNELYATLPDARRVDLADAGHMVPAETPDALIDALQVFAAEIA